jgi:hypothetical protein
MMKDRILISSGERAERDATSRRPRASLCLPLLLLIAIWLPADAQVAKDQVTFPDDPFAVQSGVDRPGWVKFVIMTDDASSVIFQNSNVYPFHYDFAVNELEPFAGMSPGEFDDVTLYQEGQLAVLGAVIFPPLVGGEHVIPEYGIQLVRHDPYAPTEVRDLFNLVRAAVVAGAQVQPYYFPTYAQQESAEQNQAFLEAEGIYVSSTARWADGNACYSDGWALGELKYFETDQIEAAHLNGDLLAGDILLTDEVPAEIPFVAGVISLAPATPSSHVALLAQTFGVPFTHLALAEDALRAQELVDNKIVLRAYSTHAGCDARLIDVEGVLDQPTIDSILALKDPPELNITPVEVYGAYSASTDGLQPSDIRYFGGKASNFGLLRQAIPDHSPKATAFSFDLWLGFMDQLIDGGNTLRQEIAQQLAPFSYPPDMQALSAVLDGIRDLIKDTDETSFAPFAEAAVIATLQDPQYEFDPELKIRFRSSTNVEDSDRFTGAGLFDSYSGCLADDTDADDSGPSRCDPGQANERGVFRAMRKVFASFYNLNAYVERLRHGMDESQVGMAVLAHHSFPDEIELANGVGILDRYTYSERAYLVSQVGSTSVTNPDPGVIPEEVDVYVALPSGIFPELVRPSNLVQLGDTVMEFPEEYQQLTELFLPVADAFEAVSGQSEFTLEFEYKKLAPADELIVKQVRRVPRQDTTPSITPFLIDEPTEYCVLQGEYDNVFSNHRLKSRWMLETRSLWLTEENLQDTFFGDVALEYAEACQLYGQDGPLDQWPWFTHGFANGTATEGWRFDNLQNPRTYELTVDGIPTLVAPSVSPLLVLRDFYCLSLRVDHGGAVPTVDWQGPGATTADFVRLCPCPVEQVGEQLQQRAFDDGGSVTIQTGFYWPPDPEGITAGYTAPLTRFVETAIRGLTSDPIVLHGEYAQTYRPGHHNFTEDFIFDPFQEPGIPQEQLDELAAAGVRAIYATTDGTFEIFDEAGWGDPCLWCEGFDGDHDGFCTGEPTFDCDDANPGIWSTPGEARDLGFDDAVTLVWSEPAEPGGVACAYDLLRSGDAGDFLGAGTCVESDDAQDLSALDPQEPGSGGAFFYLARASNGCPQGEGPLGQGSDGAPRPGRPCP